MKNTLFILFLLTTFNASAQDSSGIENSKSTSYIGWITKKVNFRVGPSKEYSIIKSLERGNQIFIISDVPENSYYNIIDIESNKEGYVHKAFVEFGDKIEKSKGEMFTSKGTTNKYDTEIEIYNNTNKTLTLKLNKKRFKFSPQEKRTISMKPGDVNYIASASNVIPLSGSKSFDEYSSWTWQFYIKPQYDNQINIEKIKVPDFKFEKIKVPNFKVPEIPKSDNKAYWNKTVYTPTTNAFDNFKINQKKTKESYNSDGDKKSKLKDYQGAISDYTKAIDIDPNYSIAYFNRGFVKSKLKDYYGAISDYNKAIEHNPNHRNSYINRGIAKGNLKDYYGAISDYNKAIEIDPNYSISYTNRGVSKVNLKDYQGAISDYTRAIEIDPNYSIAYFNRGVVKSKLKDYYGAISDYNKAIEHNPNHRNSYINRGIAKENIGDLEGACLDWQKAANIGHKDAKIWVEKQCK